jgi:hypothetical protein
MGQIPVGAQIERGVAVMPVARIRNVDRSRSAWRIQFVEAFALWMEMSALPDPRAAGAGTCPLADVARFDHLRGRATADAGQSTPDRCPFDVIEIDAALVRTLACASLSTVVATFWRTMQIQSETPWRR